MKTSFADMDLCFDWCDDKTDAKYPMPFAYLGTSLK